MIVNRDIAVNGGGCGASKPMDLYNYDRRASNVAPSTECLTFVFKVKLSEGFVLRFGIKKLISGS